MKEFSKVLLKLLLTLALILLLITVQGLVVQWLVKYIFNINISIGQGVALPVLTGLLFNPVEK